MLRRAIPYLSWICLLAAVAAWAGAGYFAWTISARADARAERLAALEQESARHAAGLRLHALARETREARDALEGIARPGIIEMIESIEAAGRDAGISLEIGEAAFAPSDPAARTRTLAFTVEGGGTFSKVMHAAALLESLPLPSSVDDVQLENLPAGAAASGRSGAGSWRLVIRIRFLTTADISS